MIAPTAPAPSESLDQACLRNAAPSAVAYIPDHLTRLAFDHALGHESATVVVTVVTTIRGLWTTVEPQPPPLVVFSLDQAEGDGIDQLGKLIRERLARRLLIISDRQDETTHCFLQEFAISGRWCPNSPEAVLPDLLRRALSTHPQRVPGVTRAPTFRGLLTDTERLALTAIGDGADDGKGAQRLGMSLSAVQQHRKRVMGKLGVSCRTELLRCALQLGVARTTPSGDLLPVGLQTLLDRRNAGLVVSPTQASRNPWAVTNDSNVVGVV